MPLFQATQAGLGTDAPATVAGADLPFALAVGNWVELQQDGQLLRWQFTWASPHGTLMLFTDAAASSSASCPRHR